MEILINLLPIFKLGIILFFIYFLVKLLLKNNVEYIKSVRSLVTILVAYTLCKLTELDKIDTKDFIIICQAIFNFYFLVKTRKINEINGEK
jgi:hypothetical protein